MAIGMGLMCGFHYKENFNYPYIASSVTDFLAAVAHFAFHLLPGLCVYPAGRQPPGQGRQLLNLFIVWGLTGLWHGASWNYVLWGLYFFLFLVIEKFLLGEKQQRIPAVLRHLFLLIIVYFCWVIFRFRDAAALGMALRGLFGGGTAAAGMAAGLSLKNNIFLLLVACVACTPLTAKLWQRWKAAAQGTASLPGTGCCGRGCRMGSDPSGSAAAVGGNGAGRGQLQSVPVFPVLRKKSLRGRRAQPSAKPKAARESARSPSSGRAGCAPIPAVFADWRRCRDDLPAVCRAGQDWKPAF